MAFYVKICISDYEYYSLVDFVEIFQNFEKNSWSTMVFIAVQSD